MNQSRMPSPAILVAVLALIAALAGTAMAGPDANTAVSKKKTKKIAKKQANKVFNERADELLGPPGEQGLTGQPGLPGTPGENATKLFAYIKDNGPTATAALEYGSGVTGVDDPAGNSVYTVTFSRDLSNCVAQAVSGFGHPSTGDFEASPFIPILWMASPQTGSDPREVNVDFRPPSAGSNASDTSFMITAFC